MATIETTTTTRTGRTGAQWAALVFGIVFILVAALGFVQGGMSMEADPARAPRVLGLFPVNLVHNVVHLLFGLWGIGAARTHPAARSYCIGAGLIYLVLAALGYVTPDGFGLVPLGGADPLLHLVLAVPLLVIGLASRDRVVTETVRTV